MPGMDRETGAALGGTAHIRQSITDILTTPKGTRVTRREYGSNLIDLIDEPMTPGLHARIVAEVRDAIDAYEKRVKLSRVNIISVEPGKMTFELVGVFTDTGLPFTQKETLAI